MTAGAPGDTTGKERPLRVAADDDRPRALHTLKRKTMPTSTWLLTDYSGGTVIVSGTPLYLMYDSAGRPYITGNSSRLFYSAECTTDALTVAVDITADNSGNDDLGESASSPQKEPSGHGGSYTWQGFTNKRVLLSFTVPGTTGVDWGWNFGNLPPIALKMKIKVKR